MSDARSAGGEANREAQSDARSAGGEANREAPSDAPAAGRTIPFLDLADPRFSTTSPQVAQARAAGWYARTSYGLAVLRYDQAVRLARHPAVRQGSAAWLAHHGITSGPLAEWWASWVLNREGADHQRLRRLLGRGFTRRIIDSLAPRFAAVAAELAAPVAAAGRCEFMAEFAGPYAARAIAILLGIPEADWPAIAADSAAIGLTMGVQVREHLPVIEAALARLHRYADGLVASRRARPRGDFVTALVQARDGASMLSESELRDSLALLIFGGFDTTRNQLGLAMQVFTSHPRQWDLLGRQPGLGPAAVEEVMRVSPTTTWVTREAAADLSFEGLDIAAGTTIHLLTAAAGTDPLACPGPGFDITAAGRPPHLAFGAGLHYCLGHLVARADLSIALTTLARWLGPPRPDGPADWLPCSGNTGPARLPLAFGPPGAHIRAAAGQAEGTAGPHAGRGS